MKFIYIFILLIISISLFSQNVNNQQDTITRKVEIINSDIMEYDKNVVVGANRLLGNVVFFHDSAYMFCDSAYFYQESNSFVAYSRVKMVRGDTVLFLCNLLNYDGNERLAKMRDSVVLKHNHTYLLTNFLDYDRNTEIANYYKGGTILDSVNKLTSLRGYYYVKDRDYYAVDSVTLKNPDYYIVTDSLKYNTNSEIADFFGKTEIFSDTNYIYCEYGFYDTKHNYAAVSRNSWIRTGHNFIYGDSLYYDRNKGFAEAFNNVSLVDTTDNFIAFGDYGYYYENPENALLTQRVELQYITDENDTIFMHADTIRITTDTNDLKLIRAFHHVQIFKENLQARCDSMTFNQQDSIIHLFQNPFLWAEGNKQAKAEHIYGHFKDKKADYFVLKKNAFVIEKLDDIFYNQVSCDSIRVIITDNQIDSINCFKNSKSIYYIPQDEESGLVNQMNYCETVDMTIYINEKTLDYIWIYGKTDAYVYPIERIPADKYKLQNFNWQNDLRPFSKQEIFIWKEER